jgi:DNA repair protein RadC
MIKMDNTKQTEGHRKRLRDKFVKSKFDGFHDYEIVELLLAYAIPRKDTKPIAKALLQKFKSIRQILDAPIEELKEIDGLGENVSVFLKIIRETIAKYFQDATLERKAFLKLDDLVAYLRATIGGKQNEILYALYLNSKNELLSAEDLGEGTVTEAVAFPRKIVESALRHKATSVIIAHNHPGGVAEPSKNDDAMTKAINDALKTVDVDLQEHIIINDDGFYSYRKNGFFD